MTTTTDKTKALEQFTRALNAQIRTGVRRVNQDDEIAPLHCCAEWHFSRMEGAGVTLVPLLYGISWHLAGDPEKDPQASGDFYLNLRDLAQFLEADEDDIYAAATLLRVAGWWQVLEEKLGKPTHYRPVGHTEWSAAHSDCCVIKQEFPHQEKTELQMLGRQLHKFLGGAKLFDNVVRGWRKLAPSDDALCAAAKAFMQTDRGQGAGAGRHQRFGAYLRALAKPKS
jgi:hypothetical protein